MSAAFRRRRISELLTRYRAIPVDGRFRILDVEAKGADDRYLPGRTYDSEAMAKAGALDQVAADIEELFLSEGEGR